MEAAATATAEMADLPATANGDIAEQNASKTIHENVCPHLKELVDDVCEAGINLFMRL